MASILEIIKVISTLVPTFDGTQNKLANVLSAFNACKALVNENNKAVAIQTILSKLEGKARAAVTENPESIDEIINKLKLKCSHSTAPNTIIAKLGAIKQKENFGKFTEEIEKLTLDLERAYIEENVPLETASKLATSTGIKALISGVKNEETKLLLKAGQFATLSKAVEKASENEAEKQTNTANVFSIQSRNFQRGRGSSNNYNNNNYQNNRGNYQSNRGNFQNYRGNSQNHRGNFQNHRGNFHQNRGNFQNFQSNRGNFPRFNNRGRGFYNNSGPGSRGVYYYISENPQVPQPQVGGQQIMPIATQQQSPRQQPQQQQQQFQIALANMQHPRQ